MRYAGGMRRISASKFKATCLALMDEVQATGESIVITKRGKPVGTFVPMGDAPMPKRRLGGMRGTVTYADGFDFTAPTGAEDDWNWEWAE